MILQSCTPPNYGTGLLATILAGVDQTGCNYVQGAFQELARTLTQGGAGASVASLMLILYVIFWGYGIWSGTATGTATDAAFRLFRVFVIYTLATTWSDFTSFAYTALNDGPAAIGDRLLSVGNNFQYTSENGVVSAMENIWNQISQGFQLHWSWSLQSFAAALVGIACVVIIALFLAVSICMIILSKIFLWLLLGLAPFVILLLLFNASARYFSGWLNGLVLYASLQTLCYAFLAFYLTVTKSTFDRLGQALQTGQVDWSTLAPFFIVGLTGVYLASQLPGLAATIAGGIPIGAITLGQVWRATFGTAANAALDARAPFGFGNRLGVDRSWRDRRIRSRHERIYGRTAAEVMAKKMDQI